ncbi:MAG: cyclomaltodextrinase N-terminal domain-containing protein, partial [Woeseiaceae bacterium]
MTRILLLAASCLLLLACSQNEAVHSREGIERVEPPFWWQGFESTELQLLVYGNDVSELTPSVEYPGIDIDRAERGDSANYLFVYLDIA